MLVLSYWDVAVIKFLRGILEFIWDWLYSRGMKEIRGVIGDSLGIPYLREVGRLCHSFSFLACNHEWTLLSMPWLSELWNGNYGGDPRLLMWRLNEWHPQSTWQRVITKSTWDVGLILSAKEMWKLLCVWNLSQVPSERRHSILFWLKTNKRNKWRKMIE